MPDGSQELYEFKTRIPKFFRTDAGIQTKEVKPNCRRLLKEMFKPGINGKVSPPFPSNIFFAGPLQQLPFIV